MPLAPDERKLITSEKLKQKYANRQAAKAASQESAPEDPVIGEETAAAEPVVTDEVSPEDEDTSKSALDLLRQKLQVIQSKFSGIQILKFVAEDSKYAAESRWTGEEPPRTQREGCALFQEQSSQEEINHLC